MILLEQTMRWYGPKDNVSLADIKQAGATGIVTALHHVPNGEIWTVDEIKKRKKLIRDAGLIWSVVESLPVHENIKTRTGDFELYIGNYKTSIKNLALCGIKTICYNFMPVLDWTRTHLNYELDNGAKALRFEMQALIAFDCFILKRPDATKDYTDTQLKQGESYFKKLSEEEKTVLTNTIIAGLPGAEEGYGLLQFQACLDSYKDVCAEILAENLRMFLDEIIPVAKANKVNMAIHPDDPPFPIFGLPRVVSICQDIKRIVSQTNETNNGITFCTGSLGIRADNDLVQIIKNYGKHIHFIHLRSTKRDRNCNFYEANHLEGDVPMYDIIKELLILLQKRNKSLPMRPDHGHQMLDDLNKTTNPGYSGIGRLKGLAELRGLEFGISKII